METRLCVLFVRIMVLVVLSGSFVQAHDYWLEPDHFIAQPGQKIRLKLFLGEDFKPEKEQVLQAARTPLMNLYSSPLRYTDLFQQENLNMSPVAVFSLPKPGSWLVGMERNMAVISFGRKKFLEYVEHEGLPLSQVTLPVDHKSVRERYSRSLKTLLHSGDKATPITTKAIGQPIEIVLSANPYATPKPEKIGLKVLYKNQPLINLQVTVLHQSKGAVQATKLMTDAKGRAEFPPIPEGRWLIRTVYLEPAPAGNLEKADWQSSWTSLTFGYD